MSGTHLRGNLDSLIDQARHHAARLLTELAVRIDTPAPGTPCPDCRIGRVHQDHCETCDILAREQQRDAAIAEGSFDEGFLVGMSSALEIER